MYARIGGRQSSASSSCLHVHLKSSALASCVKKTLEITNKHAIHILKSCTKTQAQRSGNLKVGSTALSTKNFRSMAGYGMWQRWCNSNGNNQPSFSLMFIRAWQFKLRNGSNTQMDLNVSIFKREYMKVIYFTHWHVHTSQNWKQLNCRETMWRDWGFSPWDLPPSLPFAFTIHRKWSDLAIEISLHLRWDWPAFPLPFFPPLGMRSPLCPSSPGPHTMT